MWIFPYNFYSRSARLLAEHLGARIIRHERSRYRGRPNKVVINWGSSVLPDEVHRSTVLNGAQRVAYMTNKLKFFELCKKAFRIPPFTTNVEEAKVWLQKGKYVCARTILNGHSAHGLVLLNPGAVLHIVDAPLYTQYVPKRHEYRVHCVKLTDGDIQTFSQRKARRRDVPDGAVNWKVRNLDGGFVYVIDDDPPGDVLEQAIKAFRKIGLDFGAVDVIWNEEARKAYVLEVNTAPGLEDRTAEFYATSLSRRANRMFYG